MSVFQLQEWWTVQAGDKEEYDQGSMIVGNIDNANPGVDKIMIGSQQGMIRIYAPSKPQYRVEDLVYESDLGFPILQLTLGKFIPSSKDRNGVAVLHPRKVVVYEVIPQGGQNGRINFYNLEKLYEHNLGPDGKHFTAFNMAHGPFGGQEGRDMFLIQSVDGKMQVFEQSSHAFTRQLMDCLMPGPITFIPCQDAFVTANFANRVECYCYQVLAHAQTDIGSRETDKNIKNAFGLTNVRSALVEYSINLGETCRQFVQGRFSKGEKRASDELIVITDKSMVLFKDMGVIVHQRRLEKEPSCACAYPSGVGQGHNLLLANMDRTVQVFADMVLVSHRV